jgi:hypothetical protein
MIDAEKGRLSRRAILTGIAVSGAGAGAAALALGGRFVPEASDAEGSWWSSPPVALETAAARDWAGRIGTDFEIQSEAGPVAMRLVAVTPFQSSGERPPEAWRQRAFMAVFEAQEAQFPAGDRIYSAMHSTGAFDIFLSAPDQTGSRPRLNAVFN